MYSLTIKLKLLEKEEDFVKKTSKFLSVSALALTMFGVSVFPNTSFASSEVKPTTSGVTKIADKNTVVSEPLTIEQLAEEIAKDNNIPKERALKNLMSQVGNDKSQVRSLGTAYRTITTSFTVTNYYKPAVKFYCETNESGGSFRAIEKVLNIGLNRNYNGTSKQFSGSVYANLEDPNTIYWNVNGDFFNNGTTTGNGGVNISVGQAASVNFGISYASNFYKYYYGDGRSTY